MVHAIAATPSTRLALAAAPVLALYFLVLGVARPIVRPYEYSDFVTFYAASGAFAAHQSPYGPEALAATTPTGFSGWVGRYLYPPPFAAVYVRPLRLLAFPAARAIWVLLETFAYLAAAFLLTRCTCVKTTKRTLLWTACLFLAFSPFHFDLRLGSVSGHLLFLCSCFLLARHRGRTAWAALALAAAILLKLTPALLLLVLALRREFRLLGLTLAAAVGVILLCLPWTGIHAYGDYVLRVFPALLQDNYSWFSNQSLDAFFWRLFVSNPDTTPWVTSPLLHVLCTSVLSGIVLLTLVGVTRLERRNAPGEELAPALALLTACIVARVTWEYMVVLALPAFLVGLRYWHRGAMRPHAVLGLALAFFLCAAPIPYTRAPLRSGWGILLMTPRLYGMLLLWAILVMESLKAFRIGRISAEAPGGS